MAGFRAMTDELAGADIAQLEALRNEVNKRIAELKAIQTDLDSWITGSTVIWQGADANSFRSQWKGSYSDFITDALQFLEKAKGFLNDSIEQQRTVSNQLS